MGFNEIARFEKVNKTQASVIMFQNNLLILIPVSKKQSLMLDTDVLFSLTGYFFSIQLREIKFFLFRVGCLGKISPYLNFCVSGFKLIYFFYQPFCFVSRVIDISSRELFFSLINVLLIIINFDEGPFSWPLAQLV